ncbi:EI24 domain-containing protein [Nitrosomonas sp.]|uniref:EI24 domain-containing protein n=1 Tax=Nitrosomonas sp. TaxID=42353 RepID=UPI001D9B1146|nr:EI24 domain-containing protein [Nitrosomonas sp.]MBX3617460.1 EI24 domain-containing protein [Nitrosomonas sp.]
MSFVTKAIVSAFRDLVRFKIAWIILWPIIASILFWFFAGYFFYDTFSTWIHLFLNETKIFEWIISLQSDWLESFILGLIDVVVFIPLVVITTLVLTAIFVMPALIKIVAKQYYPDLKREYGGTISGSIVNAIVASVGFIAIWVITLPLWAVGAGIIVPIVAASFMNQQLFRYDALSEHANKFEFDRICSENRYSLWSLGLFTSLIQFIPFLNLLAPIFTALAFIHFGLDHLQILRTDKNKALN